MPKYSLLKGEAQIQNQKLGRIGVSGWSAVVFPATIYLPLLYKCNRGKKEMDLTIESPRFQVEYWSTQNYFLKAII